MIGRGKILGAIRKLKKTKKHRNSLSMNFVAFFACSVYFLIFDSTICLAYKSHQTNSPFLEINIFYPNNVEEKNQTWPFDFRYRNLLHFFFKGKRERRGG